MAASHDVFRTVNAGYHGGFSSGEKAGDEADGRQNPDYGKQENEAKEPGCRVDEMQNEIFH